MSFEHRYRDFLQRPAPTQSDVEALFASAASVAIFDDGVQDGIRLGDTLLFTSSEQHDLRELADALEIEGGSSTCLCLGDLAIELRDREGSPLAVIALHHAKSIRWVRWVADGRLRHADRLVDWLIARGVWPKLDDDQLRQRCLRRIERHLGVNLHRKDRGIHASDDDRVVVSLAIAAWHGPDDSAPRTFAVRGDQFAHLRKAERGWCAVSCAWPDVIALMPLEVVLAQLGDQTDIPLPHAAHFVLFEISGRGDATTLRLTPRGVATPIGEYILP